MPACAVKLCRNSQSNNKKDTRITYHHISEYTVLYTSQKARCASSHQSKDPSEQRPWSSSAQYRTVQRNNSLLLEAVQSEDEEKVAVLLQAAASPNATCRDSRVTACHVAALSDGAALALLLKAGADGQRMDRFGRTPLHLAAWAGRAGQIAVLLNFPPDFENRVAETSQHTEDTKKLLKKMNRAVNLGCELVVEPRLSEHESDNMRHECATQYLPRLELGWTALHAACAGARARCARLLLAAGADARARDAVGRTPLDVIGSSYYFGHDINIQDFSEVMRLLRNAGAEFSDLRTEGVKYDSPLHTAVELGSLEAIKQLLDAGARVDCLNTVGQTPMHICVKKQLKEHLELLANYDYKYECFGPKEVTVNLQEVTSGHTVLHAAVADGWLQGVCVALDAGASVSVPDNCNDYSIHTAAYLGDTRILQEIISATESSADIERCNGSGETALFKAIAQNRVDCIRLLLSNGASVTHVLQDNTNVLHVAAEHGNLDALDLLLSQEDDVSHMINSLTNLKGFSPMYLAVQNNHAACVELLLSKKASLVTNHGATTCLHVAAAKNRYEIVKIIIDNDNETVKIYNCAGYLPLREAIVYGARDVIALLLRNGADLSGYINREKSIRAIDLIINHISKPTEFLEEVFDSYILFKDINHEDCTVNLDFSILMPTADNSKQMNVVRCLATENKRDQTRKLLVHPLIESFIYIKWIELVPLFYFISCVHAVVLLLITGYVITILYCKNNKMDIPVLFEPKYWSYFAFSVATPLIVFASYIMKDNKISRVETWIKFGALFLLILTPLSLTWESELGVEWAGHICGTGLLLNWIYITFVVSRFHSCGYYIRMFEKVAINVVKILLTFACVLMGFTLSFMIQFRFQHPFQDPLAAFVKTVVSMTAEFEYNEDFNKNSVVRITFLVFVILCSIVLMTLMLAVAVDDLKDLKTTSTIEKLMRIANFLKAADIKFHNKYINKLIPKCVYRYITITRRKSAVLRRLDNICKYRYLPMNVRDAIFEKARQNELKVKTATVKEQV